MKIFLKIRYYKCCITIELIEEIDLAKSNKSKECMICHYCFFNHGLNFQDYASNHCDDLHC